MGASNVSDRGCTWYGGSLVVVPFVGHRIAIVGALLLVAASSRAEGADKTRCAASYEQAQVFRRAENLEAARAQLLVCSEACPLAAQRDCARWLSEIGALVPSVRFVARDASGASLEDVRVIENGKVVATGASVVDVAPGPHVFRFERAGSQPVEVRVNIHAGEREHPVAVTMASSESITREGEPSRSAVPSISLAAIGGALLVASGALSIKGHLERSHLRDTCAGHCAASDVDAIRTTWWTAVGLGAAGALAAGAAILLWPRSKGSSVGLGVSPVAITVDIPLS